MSSVVSSVPNASVTGSNGYESLPQWLRDECLFCCWKWDERDGELTKVPYNPNTGRRGDSSNPEAFADLDTVLRVASSYDGIGVGVFGLDGIDLDHVLNEDGTLKDNEKGRVARDVLDMMREAYTEISPSGDGLHILFRSSISSFFGGNKEAYAARYYFNRSKKLGIEVYPSGMTNKYLTLTGRVYRSETEAGDRVNDLLAVLDKYMLRKPKTDNAASSDVSAKQLEITSPTRDTDAASLKDDEILDLARNAANGGKFSDLYDTPNGWASHYESHSEADQALCNMLAFWCGKDATVMDRMFRGSVLMREKWDERRGAKTYGQMTIDKAIENTRDTYRPPRFTVLPALSERPGLPRVDYVKACKNAKLTPYDVSDKGLSKLFAQIHGDAVAYVPEWKSFAVYNGAYWQVSGAEQVLDRLIKRFITGVQIWSNQLIYEDDRDYAKKRANGYDRYRSRQALRDDLKSELVISATAFDQDPHLLNVGNKTISFTGDIPIVKDHSATDRITHVAPVTYDPDADCPLFLSTLSYCLNGDVDLIEFVQKLFGIICAGDTSRDFFAALGTVPRSGKDTITGTLSAMLGNVDEVTGYAVHVMPETFATKHYSNSSGPSSDRARMQGKRLILTSEFRGGLELDTGLLKQLTGGAPIAARRMRRDEVQFCLQGIIVMLTNIWPAVNDPTLFTSDRVVAIPFDRGIKEQERDITLRHRLRNPKELSGLLNWCIEGYRKVRSEGFERPDEVKRKTNAFLTQADHIARFLRETLVVDADSYVTLGDLHAAYKLWSADGQALGRNEFMDRVRQIVRVQNRATVNGERVRNVVLGYRIAGK